MTAFGTRIGVAVSGGADSVFLLHALHELGLAAAVLHVNHELRCDESEADEEFVRNLAAELGLPALVSQLPPGAGNVEQEARRARYQFFRSQIDGGLCDSVATGHTLDDQAETLVSRFLRGAGTAGLSGIRWQTEEKIVRPMLELRRDEIRHWLREQRIAWRDDSSNSDESFLRNRIRMQLMPQLVALNPSLPELLSSTANWAQSEEEYWAEEIERIASQHLIRRPEAILMRTGPFLELPEAVQRRLLRHGIELVRGSLRGIDFRHIEAIRVLSSSLEGSGRIQLPDLDIYRSFDWLRLAPIGIDSRLERDFETSLPVPGRVSLPERGLSLEMELVSAADVYNNQMNVLNWSGCAGPLMLRNWRPGDSYRPLGKSGTEKIKSLFQEFRVPLWERRTWPVITSGDAIIWTRRFGPAASLAVTSPDQTECEGVLLIREHEAVREHRESNFALSASKLTGGAFEQENQATSSRRFADRAQSAEEVL